MKNDARAFRVPLALDRHGRLLSPGEVGSGEPIACPGCGLSLVLRAGAVRAHHFAHPSGTPCSPESALHRTAKLLVAQAVNDWRTHTMPPPKIVRTCKNSGCHEKHPQPLPNNVARAAVERRLPSGLVVDVALEDSKENVVAAVEVFFSHEVSDAKSARLDLPWIELAADGILDNPTLWIPTKSGHLRSWTCSECTKIAKAEAREQERNRAETERNERLANDLLRFNLSAYPSYSKGAVTRCPRCARPVWTLNWPGKHADRWQEPIRNRAPHPRPPIVQTRKVASCEWSDRVDRTGRTSRHWDIFKAWVTVCSVCEALLEYDEPRRAFAYMRAVKHGRP